MNTKQNTRDFESLAAAAYQSFAPVAARYFYSFRRNAVTLHGTPCMLFLGNHSSGKSTLVNWILGGDKIQDTGLAPTDDGFTVIAYGEREEDVCGPAALSRLPAEFAALESFGPSFLQRLKLKVRNRDLLKTVTLVDSPGMIDSAEGTVSRDYNFPGAVKLFAETCDMVFFLLDPDKPGTTGETVTVFSKCLSGMEFKLRVLLNKCDAFTGVYDFARTYGTVCWNLARVLNTKDLPKIWTVYAGEPRESQDFDFSDFHRHRSEFLSVLRDAPARRRDNVYSQALADFGGLSLRMRMLNAAARSFTLFSIAYSAISASLVALSAFAVQKIVQASFSLGPAASGVAAGVVAVGLAALAFWLHRPARSAFRVVLSWHADDLFASVYRRELAASNPEDLRQRWQSDRDETARIIRSAPLRLPLLGSLLRRRLDHSTSRLLSAFT